MVNLVKPCGDGPITRVTTQHSTCQDAVVLNFVEGTQSATFIKALTKPHGQGRHIVLMMSRSWIYTQFFLYTCHEIVAISVQAVNLFSGQGLWLLHLN